MVAFNNGSIIYHYEMRTMLLSPAYILVTMPVYDPTELLRANRVATVQPFIAPTEPRTLSRHDPDQALPQASHPVSSFGDIYAPWCHLVFRHASVMTAVVIG